MMNFFSGAALLLLGSNLMMPAFANIKDVRFETPSENIFCLYWDTRKAVYCDIRIHAWKNLPYYDGYPGVQPPGSIGTRFMIPKVGSAVEVRDKDPDSLGSKGFILQYGNRITFGPIICESAEIGLTCTNKSGGLLHLNRDFYVLNQPVPK